MTAGSTPVVVMEFFSAGGRLDGATDGGGAGRRPDDAQRRGDGRGLRAEGRALLAALLDDLAALPGVRPAAVIDRPTAAALEGGADPVSPGDTLDGVDVEPAPASGDPVEAAIRAASDRPGALLWPVAPETRGRLERACRAAEEAGVRLVGPSSRGVRRAARRRELLARLDRAGLPTPPTAAASSPDDAVRRARAAGWPAVIKPGRGAGAAGTTRVDGESSVEAAWSRAAAVEPALPPLVQTFVEGDPASAVLLVGRSGRVRPLAFSRQRVRFAPDARYEGGRTPYPHPAARRALDVAVGAARAVGGLRGLVGVDLVLAPDRPVVMEINPRLTTSYLGLRRHAGAAPAAAALRASGVRPAGPDPAEAALPLGLGDGVREAVSFPVGAGGRR